MKFYPVKSDARYVIERKGRLWVLSFDGNVIASSLYRAAMVVRAVAGKARRDGALVVEWITS